MARLPIVNGDENQWGTVLNEYLEVEHTSGGFHQTFTGPLTVANSLGVGTLAASAMVHAINTTEQLRLGYDASNYTSFTVDSSGALQIQAGSVLQLNPTSSIVQIGDRSITPTAGSMLSVENATNAYITVASGDSSLAGMLIQDSTGIRGGVVYTHTSDSIDLRCGGNTARATVTAAGLAVDNVAPAARLSIGTAATSLPSDGTDSVAAVGAVVSIAASSNQYAMGIRNPRGGSVGGSGLLIQAGISSYTDDYILRCQDGEATPADAFTVKTNKEVSAAGDMDVVGDLTAGTIQADNGFTGTGAYTNFTIVGGVITAAS